MATQQALVTAEDLLNLPEDETRREILQGELIEMPPASGDHGDIAMEVGAQLRIFGKQHKLGKAYAAETGFLLERNPDTVMAPDVSFIIQERLPGDGSFRSFIPMVPDLVVEVVSPNDSAGMVQRKTAKWLGFGVRLVWIIYPDTKSVMAYRSLDSVRTFGPEDTLTGDPVLPGFSCRVKELFG